MTCVVSANRLSPGTLLGCAIDYDVNGFLERLLRPSPLAVDACTGRLHPPADANWLRAIAPASDCCEQNVVIDRVPWKPAGNAAIFATCRVISPGQPLKAWFSPFLVIQRNIPILQAQHIKSHVCYECQACHANYPSPNQLKAHLFLRVCELSGEETSFKSVSRAGLREVEEATPSASEGTSSLEDSSLVKSTAASPLVEERGLARSHQCLFCGKLYSRKYGLKIHVRTHTGYKPLQCRICRRRFGDPSNLNKHLRLHASSLRGDDPATGPINNNNPYSCEHCDKVLARRRDLDRHMRTRHPHLVDQAGPPLTNV